MAETINVGTLSVEVVKKDIKNIHLSVYPPAGRVRIAAPLRMKAEAIRLFAISKLGWIKRQQSKLKAQERETQREYLERESHFVWGRRYLLEVVETDGPSAIELKHRTLTLRCRPGMSRDKRHAIIEEWYRDQIKDTAPRLIAKYEKRMGVSVRRLFVQRMKTKWGSCNPQSRSIRLNTELAKKPVECLEYIVAHEMTHLLVRHHNDAFARLMNQHFPTWQQVRHTLNADPLAHVDWSY